MLRARCISCVSEYTRKLTEKKQSLRPKRQPKPDLIDCSKCGRVTPTWFLEPGRLYCRACRAIARHPEVERPPFDAFRSRLLELSELKRLRDTEGRPSDREKNRRLTLQREWAKKRTPEQRQAERAKIRAKKGKPYTPGGSEALRERLHKGTKNGFYKRLGPAFERHMDRLAAWNAVEAFDWWIRHKAHPDAVAAFYADRPWANPRLSSAEQYRVRYAMDPAFNAGERLRRQIKKASQRDGVAETIRLAIRRNGSSPFVKRELGYTIAELRRHLERQFLPGMSWQAYLDGQIHIDHIRPKASFDLSQHEDWVACWCLSNLRPLWAKDNLAKSDKRHFLL